MEDQPRRAPGSSRAAREARQAAAAKEATSTAPDRKVERDRARNRAERERVRRELAAERDGTPPPPRSRISRSKLLALVAGVAVLLLAVGYAVVTLRDDGPSATTDPTVATSSSAPSLITAATMLTPDDAAEIARGRTWKVALDQRGRNDSSPTPACVASTPPEGQPSPQRLQLRTLTASGDDELALLHQAQVYGSTEAAIQAFTLIVKGFGECAMPGAWISDGRTVAGVGDQVVAVLLTVQDDPVQHRTVLVNRTGRLVNVVDVARNGDAVPVAGPLAALARVTDRECTAAVGLCSGVVEVTAGPPPLGGDQPGFLALADLPPAAPEGSDAAATEGRWSGLDPDTPSTITSGCENTDFTTTPAVSRVARTYLWSLTPAKSTFGLDENVITVDSATEADALVKRVVDNLKGCRKRLLTATTSDPVEVSGVGAQRAEVSGYVATVEQKTDTQTYDYRVAIVASGNKVVYLLLPTESELDLTDTQWETVAVRAAQRATQVQ